MTKIGIDVGGTNTDAVLLEDTAVLAAVKTPTTKDVTSGIRTALALLLGQSAADLAKVDSVMIGTTHFTNAVIQRRSLQKIAAVRVGLPASASLPPFCDWPEDLAAIVDGGHHMVRGGHEYDGRPIVPFDTAGMREVAAKVARFRGEQRRDQRDLLAADGRGRGAGRRDSARGSAGAFGHAQPRARPAGPARARERRRC